MNTYCEMHPISMNYTLVEVVLMVLIDMVELNIHTDGVVVTILYKNTDTFQKAT